MKKLEKMTRKALAALMALVMVLTMLPTVLVDTAYAAADYKVTEDSTYFWSEQGLRDLITNTTDRVYAEFVNSAADLKNSDKAKLTITSDLIIPERVHVYMGDGQLVIPSGKTLTLNGTMEVRYNKVQGNVVMGEDAEFVKFETATDGDSLVSALRTVGAAVKADGASYSVYMENSMTVNGDLTVPAGVELFSGYQRALTVAGKLTIAASGASAYFIGPLAVGSLEIGEGSNAVATNGILFQNSLTVNGALYGGGVESYYIGTGADTSITVGAKGKLNDGVFYADSWSVAETATLDNVTPMVSVDHRDTMPLNGFYSVKKLTAAEAAAPGALQAAIDSFDTLSTKAENEQFAVVVWNESAAAPLQYTLNEDVTVGGAVDYLIFGQVGNAAGSCVTVAEGKKLTVMNEKYLSSIVPFVVNGTMDVRSNGHMIDGDPAYVHLLAGLTVNGTLTTAGIVNVTGDLTVSQNGALEQTYGTIDVTGKLTVNGTLNAQGLSLSVTGVYTKGAGATVNFGEYTTFSYQPEVEFDPDAITAALEQDNVTGVTVNITDDVTLTQDLTIPEGKHLSLDGYGTLTIASGVTLTLQGHVRAEGASPATGNMGGKIYTYDVPLVINGTLNLDGDSYLYARSRVTVNDGGKLTLSSKCEATFDYNGITVCSGGRVTNNGYVIFNSGAVAQADDWTTAWTQGDGAQALVETYLTLTESNAAAEIETAIDNLPAMQPFFRYRMFVDREDTDQWISLSQDLTVPANVVLYFSNNSVDVLKNAALTVQGELRIGENLFITGAVTVAANAFVYVGGSAIVCGTLTVNEGGRLRCDYLADSNGGEEPYGKIVCNGSIAAGRAELRHNDVVIKDDQGRVIVTTFDALKEALEQGGEIVYSASTLTISEDLTIPENVSLQIDVDTFTVNEGVTLTNRGNVDLTGDVDLYGKLDVGDWNGSRRFEVHGLCRVGGRSNVTGNALSWVAELRKSGETATLTAAEVEQAASGELVDWVAVSLEYETTLTVNDNITAEKRVSFEGSVDAQVIVNGTLSLWDGGTFYQPVTVNGAVETYGKLSLYRSDMTLTEGAKLLVRKYTDTETGRRWTGSVELGNDARILLPEGAKRSDYVIVDEGCMVGMSLYVTPDELEQTLIDCANSENQYTIQVNPTGQENESLVIGATNTVTIPANVTLNVPDFTQNGFSEVVIGAGGLTVNGELSIDVPVRVEGTLTVNGSAIFRNGYDTTVNGTVLINADGEMEAYLLCGTGTVTNNGTLTANGKKLGLTINGSGTTTIDYTRLEAANMAELKAALEELSASADNQTIYLCRSAMDETNPYFIVDESITIPRNVQLYMDDAESSGFKGLVIAENTEVAAAGQVDIWASGGITVNGTLTTSREEVERDGATYNYSGRVQAQSLTVETNGSLINNGYSTVRTRNETDAGELTVRGTVQNGNELRCARLTISGGTVTNSGWLYYGDCDTPESIINVGNGSVRWEKKIYSVADLRTLLTRTTQGTALLTLRADEILTEDLTVPENVQLSIYGDGNGDYTFTVPQNVTLTANGAMYTCESQLIVEGTLVTSDTHSAGIDKLTLTETGVWKQQGHAYSSSGDTRIVLNGTLEQSGGANMNIDSGVLQLGATFRWNHKGTISSNSETRITGYDETKYKLSNEYGDDWYLKLKGSAGGGDVDYELGDVNGDGVVDSADLLALVRHVANIEWLTDTSRADINGDGSIDAADMTALALLLEQQTAQSDTAETALVNGASASADATDAAQESDPEDDTAEIETEEAVETTETDEGIETDETVEIVETAETVETVETVEAA